MVVESKLGCFLIREMLEIPKIPSPHHLAPNKRIIHILEPVVVISRYRPHSLPLEAAPHRLSVQRDFAYPVGERAVVQLDGDAILRAVAYVESACRSAGGEALLTADEVRAPAFASLADVLVDGGEVGELGEQDVAVDEGVGYLPGVGRAGFACHGFEVAAAVVDGFADKVGGADHRARLVHSALVAFAEGARVGCTVAGGVLAEGFRQSEEFAQRGFRRPGEGVGR